MTKKKIYSEWMRLKINFWPCIRRTGGRVIYLSEDFTQLTVKLPYNWKTHNLVGSIFGGSMYASTDPFFMLMLMNILGKDYVVWDKGCVIRFKKPARQTVYAHFHITPKMLNDVRIHVTNHGKGDFVWTIQLKDKDGVVYAEFDKTIYVATKSVYESRQKNRS